MRYVQPLLTDEQAELIAAALRDAERQLTTERDNTFAGRLIDDMPEGAVTALERMDEDIASVGRLALLFQDASENPAKYPPAPKMAASLKRFRKRVAGPAPPQSLRKKRSGRHQRRRAERRLFRRNREYIEAVNQAREMYERDRLEHEQAVAEIEERIQGQPRFVITDGFGNVIMRDVPAEFIKAEDGETPLLKPTLHVVGKTE